MHHARLLALSALATCLAACADPEAAGTGVEATPAFSPSGVASLEAARQNDAHMGLARLRGALDVFASDVTLDPALSLSENADRIAARVAQRTAGCLGVQIAHDPGTSAVAAVFDPSSPCNAGAGLDLAGKISATVAREGGNLSVVFALTGFVAGGFAMNGFATLDGTQAGKLAAYRADIVSASAGHLQFEGEATATNTPGIAVQMSGKGQLDAAEIFDPPTLVPGKTCLAGPSTFTTTGFDLHFASCFPQGGEVVARTDYECLPPDAPSTDEASSTLRTQTTLRWSTATTVDEKVAAVVVASIDGVALPASPGRVGIPCKR
jgi:hypothetical protein